MPWPLRKIQVIQTKKLDGYSTYVDRKTKQRPVVGDCFYYPYRKTQEMRERGELSPKYLAQHAAHRKPICVVLPGSVWWVVDQLAYNQERGHHGEGWDVTGDIPNITCSPSINVVGIYHGFVQQGVITDDVDGRRFTPDGERQL